MFSGGQETVNDEGPSWPCFPGTCSPSPAHSALKVRATVEEDRAPAACCLGLENTSVTPPDGKIRATLKWEAN